MTSHPEFGEKTSALEVANVFADRIRGKNVVITGVAPIGVGEGTAIAFASQSPKTIILASRTQEKVLKVAEKIRSLYSPIRVEVVLMDLSSQKSIRAAAAKIASLVDQVDFLINNAGAVVQTRRVTEENIEYQLGTNHVGPFLLTNLLLPLILKAAESSPPGATRIINLASHGHRLSPIRFHDLDFTGHDIPPEEEPFAKLPPAFAKRTEDGYWPIIAYSQSKTANILFTVHLKRHLSEIGVASFAIHPGGVSTGLGREHDEETAAAMKKTSAYWKTPDEGASTTLVAALDPALDNSTGLYMADCQFVDCAEFAKDPAIAERLWHLSEDLVSEKHALPA